MNNSGLPAVLLVMVICAALLGIRQRRLMREKRRRDLAEGFGKAPSKKLSLERFARLSGFLEKHKRPYQIDAITWNDLDMDDVFRRIDSTCSAAGEEYLWYALHSPEVGEEAPVLSSEAVAYFADDANAAARLDLQMIFQDLGGPGRYSIYDYIDALDELGERSNAKHYLAIALPLAALLVMIASPQAGILLLILSLVINMATYYREKGEIEPYLISFRYILRQIPAAEEMASVGCPAVENEALLAHAGKLHALKRGSFLLGGTGDGSMMSVLMDYVRILFHLDLLRFNQMLAFFRGNRDTVDALTALIGKTDAEIAVAGFQRSLPTVCRPVFTDEKSLCAEGLYHPLLTDPVPNDLRMQGPILLTGSNASGKSTFLKASALAALCAQTLGVVPAASYSGPRFRILSSMALRDSIQSGESYFMVEIRSLKRIADAAADPVPVLCCIDEVLRGTNTVERIAASTEILRELANAGIFVLAATHDRELTRLLSDCYENAHFDETFTDTDVVFSYKLKKGPAVSRNAILLLEKVGFDKALTKRAEEMASRFESTGSWDEVDG